MKILSYIRNASAVAVIVKDDDGKVLSKTFSKERSDADIKAEILGLPSPPAPVSEESAKKEQPPVKTIPEPPIVRRERVTRQEMIDALEKAKINDYDPSRFFSLKSRYDEYLRSGK